MARRSILRRPLRTPAAAGVLLAALAACSSSGPDNGITRIDVVPAYDTLTVTSRVHLVAHAFSADGQEIGTTFLWSTGDAAIATVNDTGLVTADSLGDTYIRATVNNVANGFAYIHVVDLAAGGGGGGGGGKPPAGQ